MMLPICGLIDGKSEYFKLLIAQLGDNTGGNTAGRGVGIEEATSWKGLDLL